MTAGFKVAVFQEFAATTEQLAAIKAVCELDRAAAPSAFAKTEEELQIVATNAKLFFAQDTEAAAVDAVLEKLNAAGLDTVDRHPKTSTNFMMTDRVILKLNH